MITQYIIDWGLLESLILISMIWFHLYQLLDTENCDFNTIEFFCRSDNTQEELGELAKTANPDAIDIDDDFSSDEEAQVEGMIIFKMKILCNMYNSFFIVYLNDKYMYMQYTFGNWIKSWTFWFISKVHYSDTKCHVPFLQKWKWSLFQLKFLGL